MSTAVAIKALGPFSTDEQRRIWLEANGYFDPLLVRYFAWLGGVLTGDFGQSIIFKVPVADVLWPRLGNTAILGGITLAIVTPLSLLFGAWAGSREGSLTDRSISLFAIITTTLPEFASAVFLSAIFVFALGWFPGISSMPEGFDITQLILPVAVLVIYDFGLRHPDDPGVDGGCHDHPLYPNRNPQGTAIWPGHLAARPAERTHRAFYRDHAAIHLVALRCRRGGGLLRLPRHRVALARGRAQSGRQCH